MEAINAIRQKIGKSNVSVEAADLITHGFSKWSSINSSRMPDAVVYPASTEDVQSDARICSQFRIPMIPYGAATYIEAQISAIHGGISVDFAKMDKVIALHGDDMDVVV